MSLRHRQGAGRGGRVGDAAGRQADHHQREGQQAPGRGLRGDAEDGLARGDPAGSQHQHPRPADAIAQPAEERRRHEEGERARGQDGGQRLEAYAATRGEHREQHDDHALAQSHLQGEQQEAGLRQFPTPPPDSFLPFGMRQIRGQYSTFSFSWSVSS